MKEFGKRSASKLESTIPENLEKPENLENRAKKPKQAEKTASQNAVTLNHDAWRYAARYLPAYTFVGARSVHRVCRALNTETLKRTVKEKKSRMAIVASCQTEEDALNILSDEVLFGNLKITEIFEIAAFCPELANALFDKFYEELSQKTTLSLWILCSRDLSLAKKFIEKNKLNPFGLGKLGEYLPEIAHEILNTGDAGLDNLALMHLGFADLSVALRIINTPELCQKLDKYALGSLGECYWEVADHILNTPALLNLVEDELAVLGRHKDIGRRILENEALRGRLSRNNIVDLCRPHPRLILEMLDKPDFSQSIPPLDLAEFGRKYEVVAKKIMATEGLMSKCTARTRIASVIAPHEELAKQFLLEQEREDTLNGADLGHIGHHHKALAQRILSFPQHYQKLDGNLLSMLGREHEELAWDILDRSELYQKLNGPQLATLGQNHVRVGLKILENPLFCNQLSSTDLANLGQQKLEIAQKILSRCDVCETFSAHDVFTLAHAQSSIAQAILKIPSMWMKMENFLLMDVINRHGVMVMQQSLKSSAVRARVREDLVYDTIMEAYQHQGKLIAAIPAMVHAIKQKKQNQLTLKKIL